MGFDTQPVRMAPEEQFEGNGFEESNELNDSVVYVGTYNDVSMLPKEEKETGDGDANSANG